MIPEWQRVLAQLRLLHSDILESVLARAATDTVDELAARDVPATGDAGTGDDIFAVDRISEERLVTFFEHQIAPWLPLVLIAEGLSDTGLGPGRRVFPSGTPAEQARIRVLMDPIDGTRELMYQKRSAWILTGVAPNHGPATRLRDVELALQTELPLVKQHLADELWAVRDNGWGATRINRLTGTRERLAVHPSAARSIEYGFAALSRFFPGTRAELAAIDDEIVRATLGPVRAGKAQCWEDQYISSGGQLYELIAGHDRFVADLRPLMEPLLARQGLRLGICCHPYDLATLLIAVAAGVIITDARGAPLDAPLALEPDVAWVGYANAAIRAQVEPSLMAALARRGFA